ncbi:EamA family transporter [Aquincola sp. S2]|uniref:EamA family transporter n=1 Tax=Pseudaquabacterium terrae TaxID=2732868 RepID=A0ABX2EK49_9BURK|nr:EamA family transporter [Aquabacterium terrae]NRF69045.1 EamA family transporter [Aquabacterium terrae]
MTWPIVAAVLFGALLHAGWNALVKSSGDKELDTALVHFLGAVVALPLLLIVGPPPASAAPFIAASLVIHIGYYIALAGAYQHGELGLTYPIMRGFAPLLVAIGSGAVLGEAPTPLAWAGILGITAGVALVGLSSPGETLHHHKALAYAFANAAIIAVYTFVDGKGVRSTVDGGIGAASYVLMLSALDGVTYPALVWFRRSTEGRRAILDYARRRWPLATIGGSASIGSYAIALWAMTRAPVASVAALRETSVLFAALLGTWILKERFGRQRALGTLVIVGGVMALRLG